MGGKRQEARGKRQEARGKRQEARSKKREETIISFIENNGRGKDFLFGICCRVFFDVPLC
jgi:hypothetical protein